MTSELKKTRVCGIVDHEYMIAADFITLPQRVIHWFVGCMMPKRSIAIVPNCGYDNGKDGSIKENVWLAYLHKLHQHSKGDAFVPVTSQYCTGSVFFWTGLGNWPTNLGSVMNFMGAIIMDVDNVFHIV